METTGGSNAGHGQVKGTRQEDEAARTATRIISRTIANSIRKSSGVAGTVRGKSDLLPR
jgi:hypothetical protein